MVTRWQRTHPRGEKSATQRTVERQIGLIAGRQLGLITSAQLRSLGLSHNAVHARARRGRLYRIRQGVYATHPPPYTREQHWLAAVRACGLGAMLSHLPAAAHWTLVTNPPPVAHVTAPSGRGRSRERITVHRSVVDPRDAARKDSIPCTSVNRVLVDLAPTHTEAELESMLVAAESLRLLKRGRLAELVAERHGRPGIGKLARILALEPAVTRSTLELLFLPIWREAGVERPQVNFPIAVAGRDKPLAVDFAWPEIRMVVEADSQRFHGDWERAEADRERDQLLALAGWICHRFVRRKIKHDPAGSARRLRALNDARCAELGAPLRLG